MKPITFENLRRLVGGGRKKKDRNESSFKRSDSFKRISIRKNHVGSEQRGGGGGKGRNNPLSMSKGKVVSADDEVEEEEDEMIEVKSGDRSKKTGDKSSVGDKTSAAEILGATDSLVIGYNQWIKVIKVEEAANLSRPPSAKPPPTPPPRISGNKKSVSSTPSVDSCLEILDLEKSPEVVRRRFRQSPPRCSKDPKQQQDEGRSSGGVSISLGRIWMDAPMMAMASAPRSLELPRVANSIEANPNGCHRAHHSLESALKDKKDEKPSSGRRSYYQYHQYPSRPLSPTTYMMPNLSSVCRSLSSTTPTYSTGKTVSASSSRGSTELLSSSKDSGFSFSISIPRLSDLASPTGSSGGGGFFRKKKAAKPKTVVTESSRRVGSTTDGLSSRKLAHRTSSRRKKLDRWTARARKKSNASNGTAKSDMYQVVVGRTPRSLKSLKLDPMIFVPPEKRKPTNSMRKSWANKFEVHEVRDYCVPKDMRVASSPLNLSDDDEDEGLYECITAGDLNERDSDDVISESLSKSAGEIEGSEDGSELETGDEGDGGEGGVRGGQSSKGRDRDADTEDDTYSPLGVSPVPQRRLNRRKKSLRKNVKYLAKPMIHRAPSTLKRNRRLLKKHITSECTRLDYVL